MFHEDPDCFHGVGLRIVNVSQGLDKDPECLNSVSWVLDEDLKCFMRFGRRS